MSFRFLEPGALIDRELQLIVPEPRWIDEVLRTCAHPLGRGDPTARTTRQQVEEYLRAAPNGRYMPAPGDARVPQYQFWMRIRPTPGAVESPAPSAVRRLAPTEIEGPPVLIAGSIGLRIGDSDDLRSYLGHIGYNVYPAARGNHYAERSCRMLIPLARRHGLAELWLTCNPDNAASRRTCERLGARFIDIVPLPAHHILYQRGERQKCRYRLDLNANG